MLKADIRESIQSVVRKLSTQEVNSASHMVCETLRGLGSISTADTIFAYLPLEDEIDLRPLLQTWIDESRVVCVPLISWETQQIGAGMLGGLGSGHTVAIRHGIHEPIERTPVPHDTIDVILVPGVAFDESCGRLGRGGGFYDRFLSSSRPPIVIGVGFDEQILPDIPLEAHDQQMTMVITPTRIIL